MNSGPQRIMHVLSKAGPTAIPRELAEAQRRFDPELSVDVLVLGNETSPGTQQVTFRSLWAALRASRGTDTIVHVHHLTSGLIAAILGRMVGLCVVKTEHRDRRSLSGRQRALDLLTLLCCQTVVCNSRTTAASIPRWERWLVRAPILVVHNGVDLGLTGRWEGPGGPCHPWHLVMVGRMIREKGHDDLFDALPVVAETLARPVRVSLVGDGPRRGHLEQRARALPGGVDIEFLGQRPRSETYAVMRRADAVVVPSHTEGFCNVAVEAMAMGVPTLCTAAGAIPEVVGDTLPMVPARRPDLLAEGLLALESAQEDTRRARARAVAHFDLATSAAAYVRMYAKIRS